MNSFFYSLTSSTAILGIIFVLLAVWVIILGIIVVIRPLQAKAVLSGKKRTDEIEAIRKHNANMSVFDVNDARFGEAARYSEGSSEAYDIPSMITPAPEPAEPAQMTPEAVRDYLGISDESQTQFADDVDDSEPTPDDSDKVEEPTEATAEPSTDDSADISDVDKEDDTDEPVHPDNEVDDNATEVGSGSLEGGPEDDTPTVPALDDEGSDGRGDEGRNGVAQQVGSGDSGLLNDLQAVATNPDGPSDGVAGHTDVTPATPELPAAPVRVSEEDSNASKSDHTHSIPVPTLPAAPSLGISPSDEAPTEVIPPIKAGQLSPAVDDGDETTPDLSDDELPPASETVSDLNGDSEENTETVPDLSDDSLPRDSDKVDASSTVSDLDSSDSYTDIHPTGSYEGFLSSDSVLEDIEKIVGKHGN